jgi:tetratricopeptide (TPR) repeat protein
LGLCSNFFGRTNESEFHFRKMLESDNPAAQVKASYVLSMLYLRMHNKEKQDLVTAENFLNNAYKILQDNPGLDDIEFHQVFNRNGYALCLYRRGKILEALEMLENGIAILKKDESGARKLHQSVLIYNAVQCLRSLERYEDCESKCRELLAIDPLFPEYHMEHSRVLLEQNKIGEALQALGRGIELDPDIAESYSLLGYAYLQNEDLERAYANYLKASMLSPESVQLKLDLGYCLSELKRWHELEKLLLSIEFSKLTAEEKTAYFGLKDSY